DCGAVRLSRQSRHPRRAGGPARPEVRLEHPPADLAHPVHGPDRRPAVSRSLLGNSWFWLVGAVYLTQIPGLSRDWLHGDESVATLILLVFSVGIALGSMLCERLSGHKVEIGLVPFGSLGLSLFGLLL